MSAAAVMAIILFAFFVVGAAVGVLVVIALSARRAHQAARRTGSPPVRWPHRPDTDPDDDGPNEPGWWQTRGGG
jgi:hypothetical protein